MRYFIGVGQKRSIHNRKMTGDMVEVLHGLCNMLSEVSKTLAGEVPRAF